MRLAILMAIIALYFSSNAQKLRGGLIYTLGKDTTIVGNYHLEGNVFYIHAVSFTPSLNVHQLRGRLFENGEMEMAEGMNVKPIAGKPDSLVFSYRLHSLGDSTYIEQKRGETVSKQQFKGRTMISNSVGGQSMIYLLPILSQFAPANTGDSVSSSHFVFNSPRPFVIRRQSEKTLVMGSGVMGYFKVFVDREGNATGVDATGSSWNVKGQMVSLLNMDSVVRAAQRRENSGRTFGIINKLDSVQADIGGVAMKIKYSRPSVRGRVIFGEVVPWNRFWRTGANAATRLSISQPIYFGDKELPAGDYSVWTMPSQSGWKVMFNKEANVWGTEYKPQHDVLVLPLQITSLAEPVELFTFNIQQSGNRGEISFMWEKLKGSISFTTSQ